MYKSIFLLFLVLLTYSSYAHNGAITHAKPVSNVTIDGNPSEWIDQSKGTSIAVQHYAPIMNQQDLNAQFWTAHDPSKKALYVAIEVIDNAFTANDSYVLYLDVVHSKKSPSVFLFELFEDKISTVFQEQAADLTNEDVRIDFKIGQSGNKRIIEIEVIAQDWIQANRSIGIDFFIQDDDNDENGMTYLTWTPELSKSSNSGRMGDLILVDENAEMGQLTGTVSYASSTEEPLPTAIKIQSQEQDDLWIHTKVDSLGNYSIPLPFRNYRISPAFQNTSPFAFSGYTNQLRLDDGVGVAININNKKVTAPKLSIPIIPMPSYLIPEKGILARYESNQAQEVSFFIESICHYYNIPGASVALIKEGKMVYHQNFGYKNSMTKAAVDDKTLFQAASVTKPVFAFMVMRLVEQGLIDLDRPLYKYMPFENIAHDKRYEKMTARHVLTHQSGLPNWAFGGPLGWKSGEKTDLLFTPGEKYNYSGEAFQYLGRVAEHVSEKDLNQLFKEEVLEVMEMAPMYLQGEEGLEMSRGHLPNYPTFWGMASEPGVAHSMLTESKTFAQFVCGLANQKGLSAATYKELFAPVVAADGFERPENSPYWDLSLGLGFFTQKTTQGKAVMHGGNNGDFQCEFVLFPEKKMGFIVFTNSSAGHKLGQALGDYLIYGRQK